MTLIYLFKVKEKISNFKLPISQGPKIFQPPIAIQDLLKHPEILNIFVKINNNALISALLMDTV
jgi:hypothetical protein